MRVPGEAGPLGGQGACGVDGARCGKKAPGRKRGLAVDVLGLMIAMVVLGGTASAAKP